MLPMFGFSLNHHQSTPARTLVKTLSWRTIATIMTIGLIWIFTGSFTLSVGIGAIDIITKFALFYAHERAWVRIRWGKR